MKLLEFFVRWYIRHELMRKLGVEVSSYINYLIIDEYCKNSKEIDRRLICTKKN